jgi:protein SCO1/2
MDRIKKTMRLAVPVGGSPTGTGESPVPPVLEIRPGKHRPLWPSIAAMLARAIFLVWAFPMFSRAATNTQLTDDELLQIRFEQKIGASVPPNLALTDEAGRTVHLGDYLGDKPAVLILGYYGCPMLCTLVLNGAAECFRNLSWKAGRQFNVIFVSIDPAEKPALAAEKKQSYVKSYGDSAGDWHFMTADPATISNLANAVGFHYVFDPSTKQFAHPSGFVVLTPDARVARYFFGVNFSAKDVDSALRDAAAKKIGAEEPPFTLLCFHYAPVHGKYGALILRIVRLGAIAVLAVLAGLFLIPPRRRETKP